MTEEQKQRALEWFNNLCAWTISRWPDERMEYVETIRAALSAPVRCVPEELTMEEFRKIWDKHDCWTIEGFFRKHFPNGLIIKESAATGGDQK